MGKGRSGNREVFGDGRYAWNTGSQYGPSSCDLSGPGNAPCDRITGKPERFLTETTIIHVDIDPAESPKCKTDIPVVSDVGKF